MRLSRSGYLIREGFRSITTHGFMSFASVTIIMACLIIMGSVALLTLNIHRMMNKIENRNEIMAYVDDTLSEEEALAIQPELEKIDNVSSVRFITRQEALDNFKDDYSEDMMEGVDETWLRHRYEIQIDDQSLMPQIKASLEATPGIAKVNANLENAKIIVRISNVVTIISLVLIAILAFISIFIMSNTIKLATFNRREEIAIMKMVGATNHFIRMPFIIEGLILGILGGGLAFAAEMGLYHLVTERIVSPMSENWFQLIPLQNIALPVFVAFMVASIFVGVFGGVNAIKNYLKV